MVVGERVVWEGMVVISATLLVQIWLWGGGALRETVARGFRQDWSGLFV